MVTPRPLAAVTGASSGIGLELARCCAEHGFDLLVTADEPAIHDAAELLRASGATVEAFQTDLATPVGVDEFCAAAGGRPIEALLANAGRGLGHAFLDQEFEDIRRVIDTNVTGTVYLLHKVGAEMRARGRGRILVTGTIAGFTGGFTAVYEGTKAFLDSFSLALRNELKDTGVTVTCLMPSATGTESFERVIFDTKVGQGSKDDPAFVARIGFDAMMHGEADAVTELRNKADAAGSRVTLMELLAERHRKMAGPGSAPRR